MKMTNAVLFIEMTVVDQALFSSGGHSIIIPMALLLHLTDLPDEYLTWHYLLFLTRDGSD